MAAAARPTGLIAKKGIELLTFGTPNGYKASIILEELKEAYGLPFVVQSVNIMQNIQKEPWFTALNPNGRIPVIVDHDNEQLAVFEGSAILSYLTRRYDTEHRFSFPASDNDYTRAETWIGWQHGGLGPMQGQANHFVRFAKERIPYPTQRYVGETERLFGVLNTHLDGRDFVVGPGRGRYSIADISMIGWVQGAPMAGIDINQFPSVKAWLERCLERPAVQRGIQIPDAPFMSVASMEKRLQEDEGLAEKEAEVKKQIDDAKKAYGYVYSSP
ncbi:putative Glutathione s-transferase [Colletotrichum higginsianum IMI 349063]|uniref:Glutathione S-transferase-like protein tpcF n=2 Tax=Colletotrichum higginsianum TaxID=80884 RepID=A0A4T0VDV3_9PEZI|nr:putative Glutathione s-transferase [Colletotrichum higginsianum IMI 349063]OBR03422.1 putative Glutathione s-transferase [Colletotrichum higginsianum IMI 349063]TIC89836.1 Glutathione S-transferase-like protein tpcF [Colletotrichum higginsianum]